MSIEGGYCSDYLPPTSGLPYPSTTTLGLNYLSLPLLLKLRSFKSSFLPHGFDFFAGPELEYLALTSAKITSSLPKRTQVLTFNSTSGYRRLGLGAEIGGEPNIAFGSTTVGIEFKYSPWITGVYQATRSDWFNSVWTVMAQVYIW